MAIGLSEHTLMSFIALLLNLSGATLVYLASAQQQLLTKSLPRVIRIAALALLVAGTACCVTAMGNGAGLVTALTIWMLTWVALPYLAWWRSATARSGTR